MDTTPTFKPGSDIPRWRTAAALSLGIGLLAWAWWLALGYGPDFDLWVVGKIATIRSWGAWGILASIGLMVLHSFVPFPAEVLACANGLIFGPIAGALITWIGAMLGACTAFALARRYGRPLVVRLLPQRQSARLARWVNGQGGGAVLLARLVPLIAFNLINYAAALAGIRWWTFLWTTGLGILPMTVLTAFLGDRMLAVSPWVWGAIGAIAVLSGVALHVVRRRQLD